MISVTENRMVAFCDILGFKAHLQQLGANALANKLTNNLGSHLAFILHKGPQRIKSLADLRGDPEVGLAMFSDTILFYGKHDTQEAARRIIETVSWLVFVTAFEPLLRVRCGIAYGEFFVDESFPVYVGKALVDAYHLSEKQQWFGGVLDPSACEIVKSVMPDIESMPPDKIYGDWPVVPYDVPIRENDEVHLYHTLAINCWRTAVHNARPYHRPEPRLPDDVLRKYEESINFHDEFCWRCKRASHE